ncbi:discoidin domain-containing protein [Micromonospora sp. URMC 103]|uniref:discoidin domain-containing protein n=1 Tax=Micromonospora sp. URMC 103 TaxID=3423406 RepID=UPI003F1933A2
MSKQTQDHGPETNGSRVVDDARVRPHQRHLVRHPFRSMKAIVIPMYVRNVFRLVVALLVGVTSLSVATPAWPQTSPQVYLFSEQSGRGAVGFPPNCQDAGNGPFVGLDVWSFQVMPEQGEFTALTLVFMTPEGEVLPSVSVPGPDGDLMPGTHQARVRVPAGLLIVEGSAEVTGDPIGEFSVTATCAAIPLTPDIDLAWNKPATADSRCASTQGPEMAVNGSWAGGLSDRWCSTGASKWLRVDIGSSTNIRQFVVRHAGAGGEATSLNTRAFSIQVSTDGTTWTTAVTVTANTANVTTHDVTATGRYVRLNITTPTQTTDPSARIYELEVYGGVNLALNKAATADSQCASTQGPGKAVNGSWTGGLSDRWCSTGTSKWLRVDIGSTAAIRRFLVRHAGAGGEATSFNTRAFTIQVSADGTTWTTAVTVTANTANVTTHDVTATGRYVRLNITTPTQTTDPSARIYELEVYGQVGSLPPEVNLARNRPAIANTQCTSTEGPAKAVNGSWTGGLSDRWCSTGIGSWLRVDLGTPGSLVNIRKFVLRHAGAGGEPASLNTRAFTIEMSADGIAWWTVVTVTANAANVSTHYVDAYGRYARLTVTTPTQTTDSTTRIYEFEAYPPS